MLPDGVTIERAHRAACKMARNMATDRLHFDEAESAAGLAVIQSIRKFPGGSDKLWWTYLFNNVRWMVRDARRDWLSHGVVKRGGPSLPSHEWEHEAPEPAYRVNPTAGLEAEEALARLDPDHRRVLEWLGAGHKAPEIAAMTGWMPGTVHVYASRGRRALRDA
jgi:RNA polymerase sigma factor (sigma-70 family)